MAIIINIETVEMLLALILLHLTAVTLANPFHKYPYVFLLDVGNEELEKVNTEQIRLSKAGGSLALRYPAIGNGENIAHVRVSGIDFGTDLKANIVDGGPGYQYVVIVLMGNPGVSFDAVITIQTVPNETDEVSLQNIDHNSADTSNQEENDTNDSAEDLSDSAESEEASQVSIKENAELTQESSNVYSYAINEALSGYGSDIHPSANGEDENVDDNDESDSKQKDIHTPYRENDIQDETNSKFDDYSEDYNTPTLIENQSHESQDDDDYTSVLDDQNYSYDADNQDAVKTDLYESHEKSRIDPYHRDEVVYSQNPQRFITDDSGTIYVEELGDNGGSINAEEIFDNDYDGEDSRRYNDKNNNNYIDTNGGSAIAY